jgi:hypothetical protein
VGSHDGAAYREAEPNANNGAFLRTALKLVE